jgi:hypothetical protein
MLQLKNGTPFQSTIYLMPDPDGIDSLFTVVKATLALGNRLSVAERQVPVALKDEYNGEPGKSSIKHPSDVSLIKPGTDVLLQGSAHAPGGRPAAQMDVSLVVGPLRKTIRVIGDRVWERSGLGHTMSRPAPFDKMPLAWERAFGGTDRKGAELRGEARNPVGAGFRARDGEKELDGLPLPNLEDPENLIGSWKENPPPACFAPICGHWEPRKSYAGTYDEPWQQQRAPYLPNDFDPRFLQLAPPGLVAPGYLGAGTAVEVRGVTPSGLLRFELPPVNVEITYVVDDAPQQRPANLDTILIQPDEGRVLLVWRAVLRCDKKALRVNEVRTAALKAA